MTRRRHSVRVIQSLGAAAAFVIVLVAAAPVVAHGGGLPTVIVPLDHVVPGQSFEILLSDFSPGATVHITIGDGDQAIALADATLGSDGHGTASGALPAAFPFGYVRLTVASADGVSAQTWIRVGDSAYTSPGGGAASVGPLWADPSVWILVAFAVGVLAGLVFLGRRSRRAPGP